MKYVFLTDEERKQAREQRQQAVAAELRSIEAEHYQREIDFRLANRLTPPDEARKAAARAAQTALDVRYAALAADFDAIRG